MESVSMQLPQVCPLEAPDEWRRWGESLDAASWVLWASWLIDTADANKASYEELLAYSALIDRRDAMLLELPASPAPGEAVH